MTNWISLLWIAIYPHERHDHRLANFTEVMSKGYVYPSASACAYHGIKNHNDMVNIINGIAPLIVTGRYIC